MSSRDGVGGVVACLFVGVEAFVDGSSEASFEAPQSFFGGFSFGDFLAVVGVAEAVRHADLGEGDAVQGGVELAVSCPVEADAAGGVARPDRDRGGAAVAGESGVAFLAGGGGRVGGEVGRGYVPPRPASAR